LDKLEVKKSPVPSASNNTQQAKLAEMAQVLTATYALLFAEPPIQTDTLGKILLNIRDAINNLRIELRQETGLQNKCSSK